MSAQRFATRLCKRWGWSTITRSIASVTERLRNYARRRSGNRGSADFQSEYLPHPLGQRRFPARPVPGRSSRAHLDTATLFQVGTARCAVRAAFSGAIKLPASTSFRPLLRGRGHRKRGVPTSVAVSRCARSSLAGTRVFDYNRPDSTCSPAARRDGARTSGRFTLRLGAKARMQPCKYVVSRSGINSALRKIFAAYDNSSGYC